MVLALLSAPHKIGFRSRLRVWARDTNSSRASLPASLCSAQAGNPEPQADGM